jgi:hypothetical protein
MSPLWFKSHPRDEVLKSWFVPQRLPPILAKQVDQVQVMRLDRFLQIVKGTFTVIEPGA